MRLRVSEARLSLTPRTLPLKGKVVVVTGGAGRLGKSFVRGIVANGGVGVIADVDRSLGADDLLEPGDQE